MEVFKNLESSEYVILSIFFSCSYTEVTGGLVEARPVYTGYRGGCFHGVTGEQWNNSLFMYYASYVDVLVVVSLESCFVFR